MEYYKVGRTPLMSISENDIKDGQYIYNNLGACIQKTQVGNANYLVQRVPSVLVYGELVNELTDKQLELFWTLSRTEFKKYEDKDINKGG